MIHTLLKKHFGYDEFRPLQQEIIETVLAGKDCLVLMPTGGGKSLCYQLPAVAQDGITLVISPLIALMKDQIDGLAENGITAVSLNSSLTPVERETAFQKIKNNEAKLIYIAPERFAVPEFRNFLQTIPVKLIAIDEAHCISEWGHDFRPDYRNLRQLRSVFPHIPVIAAHCNRDRESAGRHCASTESGGSKTICRKLQSTQSQLFNYSQTTQIRTYLQTTPDA